MHLLGSLYQTWCQRLLTYHLSSQDYLFPSAVSVRTLRALVALNGPDQPHLGWPPHTPCPGVPEPHLSSAQGLQSLLSYVQGVWISSSACTGL